MARMRRNFGTGHWDKKLVQRMTELSVADNWDEAKHEWKATGECWWAGNSEYMPPFVRNSQQGYGKCLCGHKVVYHFEIVNTENDAVECVGSDHIESFLIIRYLEEDMNIKDATDEQIQEWIDERMKTMKSEAWWAKNGDYFTTVLEEVREADLYFNYKRQWTYDSSMGITWMAPTKPLKRSSGEPTSLHYKMASITWRWDDSRNSRNQKSTRGYPNERLMSDLAIFYGKYIASLRDELNELKERNQERVEEMRKARVAEATRVAEYRERRDARMAREKLERKQRLKAENEAICIYLKEEPNDNLIKQSQFYDLPTFDSRHAKNQWELSFLRDMKVRLSNRESLTNAQVNTLYRIVNNTEPVTDKQLAYLKTLGYEGNEPTTKAEASRLITEYKEE